MSDFPHLPNAPITEALIDIRVQHSPDMNIERIRPFHEKFKEDFPETKTRFRFEGKFDLGEEESTVTTEVNQPNGFFYTSADEKRVLQARLDGFTFSRLKPYETWEALSGEALSYWNMYSEFTQPLSISRVAVRYINRLELPFPFKDFSEYLNAAPTIPKYLPQELLGFLTRIVVPFPENGCMAIITLSLDSIPDGNNLPILFDIDVFKEDNFDRDGKKAWETIHELRRVKNRIFFESITDKMLELCK